MKSRPFKKYLFYRTRPSFKCMMKITHAAVNININYKKSATDGDLLLIETTVKEISNKSITFHQRILMQKTKQIISDATVTNVYINSDGAVIKTEDLKRFWTDID